VRTELNWSNYCTHLRMEGEQARHWCHAKSSAAGHEVLPMSSIKIFENRQVGSQWDAERQAWYFSIGDVVGVLTDSPNPRKYRRVLKTRLKKEGGDSATSVSKKPKNLNSPSIARLKHI
jgi:hypothetical protein